LFDYPFVLIVLFYQKISVKGKKKIILFSSLQNKKSIVPVVLWCFDSLFQLIQDLNLTLPGRWKNTGALHWLDFVTWIFEGHSSL